MLPVILFLMIVPWLATFAGSMFGLKMKMGSKSRQNLLLGFAAGVMVAAVVWSLLIPAFNDSASTLQGVIITTIGFLLGCGMILLLDHVMPHQHMDEQNPEGPSSGLTRPMLLVMAVALHNIPEGLALGVILASVLSVDGMAVPAAIAFGIGLAIQNMPEGMAVVFPMRQAGISNKIAGRWGAVASFAEPVAALVGWGASSLLMQLGPVVMPLLLSLAGGAMIFIVVEELIPASQHGKDNHMPTFGFIAGFWIMALMGFVTG